MRPRMNRLILFRHGKAEPDAESGDDFDRALADRGVEEAQAMGRRLATLGFIPDVALVSAALRTRQTWDALAPAFPQAEAAFERELYHIDPRGLWLAAKRANAGCVMIVGHNPGLQDLTVRLLMEGGASAREIADAQARFPTAAASVFAIDPAGRPSFEGLYVPDRWA